MPITDGQLYRGEFKLTDNTVRVPFGDIDAIENAFRSDPAIGVIVLETVQGGGGIIQAPKRILAEAAGRSATSMA